MDRPGLIPIRTLRRGVAAALGIFLVWSFDMPGDAAAAPNQPARRGCDVALYVGPGYAGEAWRTGDDQTAISPHWSKQIVSIIVISGIWDFHADANYRGEVITLPPGAYPYVGDRWNKRIMSFRCVRPDAGTR
jgi:hypothetical protein